MNTAQLKRFAQEARRKLNTLVDGKLESVLKYDSSRLRAKQETVKELQADLQTLGRDALVDRIAYTWFNRLVALRFMDANDFQPLGINILSPAQGAAGTSPQILDDIHAGLFPEGLKLDRQYINEVLNGMKASSNPDNDIYRHVLIAVCNDLHRIFPFLFERIDDYSELLLPDDLTSPFSIIANMVNGLSAEDCAEVEIIGWFYQFYISEKKDEVFASKSKVKKEDIPAATQLFTPRWIVEYMVQNTVGKLWLQNNPQSELKQYMPYYIESPEGHSDDYLKIKSVEEIKLLDQACGSGHILVYGFELLARIYEEQGYSASDIPTKIIENNLYGLEIDERAAQLAAFAITMKARQYYRRFFRKPAEPHIVCYKDIKFSADELAIIIDQYNIKDKEAFKSDFELLEQATNLGSLIQPKTSPYTLHILQNALNEEGESGDLFLQQTQNKLRTALKQLIPLAEKYHCVVDNPPYMGSGSMNPALSDFVRTNFPKSKADLMACFMEAGITALHPNGSLGMINQHSWMFLSSYEDLRKNLIDTIHFDTLLHLGPRTFPEIGGEVVQNAAFTFANTESGNKGMYLRLVDFESTELKRQKTIEAIQNPDCGLLYTANQKDFEKIPGNNIGYWLSESIITLFDSPKILEISDSEGQTKTGNNDKYLRLLWEVSHKKINKDATWVKHPKGGTFRRWYGNVDALIDWSPNARIYYRKDKVARILVERLWWRKGISWTLITSGKQSFRDYENDAIFNLASPTLFFDKEHDRIFILGLLNTKVSELILKALNPTLNCNIGEVQSIPLPINMKYELNLLVNDNISISRLEWNSHENSSDFLQNEIVRFGKVNILSAVNAYKEYWATQFHTLHKNEEELNRQFIKIYRLQDELTPDVPLEDITILQDESEIVDGQLVFKEQELIVQLISYAVGCIFGRYSLDKEGLIWVNQGETIACYLQKVAKSIDELKFVPDENNIIPMLEEEWFDDDIVNRVKEFIRAVWGDAFYQENMQYIEEVLGKNLRRYLTKDFYKDHIKRFKKRPIYWLYSSPKGHFNVLIYMHRYTPDTLNYILNSYLRPFMEKVRNDLKRYEDIIITGSASEQGKARKRQDKLKDILKDCEVYEHDILYPLAGERIAIDLDDGVLVNYNKFGQAIAPVAGLNDVKAKKKVKGFDWIDTSSIR